MSTRPPHLTLVVLAALLQAPRPVTPAAVDHTGSAATHREPRASEVQKRPRVFDLIAIEDDIGQGLSHSRPEGEQPVSCDEPCTRFVSWDGVVRC
jgi:hypothetical protein